MARLRLFAGVKDVAGVDEIEVDVSTVGGLVAEADGRFGTEFIQARAGANLWLNGETEIDDLATPIGRKDEVAIIPPVSGGGDAPPNGQATKAKNGTPKAAAARSAKSGTKTSAAKAGATEASSSARGSSSDRARTSSTKSAGTRRKAAKR